MTVPSCRHTGQVDAHFAGRISPAEEAEMRRHLLEGCAACNFRYTRLAMVAKVQPGASKAQDRIAAGLGFGRPATPSRLPLVFGLAAAAAVLAIVFLARGREDRFATRGPALPAADLRIFQVRPGARSVPVAKRIAATDELAFAYRNGTGKRYLFIFGVDEHRHVYWFWPAWKSAAERPAPPVTMSDGAFHEIENAVRHTYDGQRLEIYGLFTNRAWQVPELDAIVALSIDRLVSADSILTLRPLEVQR
jgi:hypothetical protein